MRGYLIKASIIGGTHEGETYYLRKGGYVITRPDGGWCAEDLYKTEGAAKTVATKWNRRNDYYQRMGCTTVEPTKYEAVEVA